MRLVSGARAAHASCATTWSVGAVRVSKRTAGRAFERTECRMQANERAHSTRRRHDGKEDNFPNEKGGKRDKGGGSKSS